MLENTLLCLPPHGRARSIPVGIGAQLVTSFKPYHLIPGSIFKHGLGVGLPHKEKKHNFLNEVTLGQSCAGKCLKTGRQGVFLL